MKKPSNIPLPKEKVQLETIIESDREKYDDDFPQMNQKPDFKQSVSEGSTNASIVGATLSSSLKTRYH